MLGAVLALAVSLSPQSAGEPADPVPKPRLVTERTRADPAARAARDNRVWFDDVVVSTGYVGDGAGDRDRR